MELPKWFSYVHTVILQMRIHNNRNRSFLLLVAIVFVAMFSACKKENPVLPPDNRPILTSADYGRVVLTLTDYDVVRITHQLGPDLRSPDVVGIGIGTKDSATYRPLLSVGTTYDPASQVYSISYDFTVRLDSSEIQPRLTIRYHFANLTYADADTTVLLYKYPYQSAEIFVTNSIMADTGSMFLDIDRVGRKLFFLEGFGAGFGSLGEYDLDAQLTRRLGVYPRGGTIAADSVFVFFSSNSVLSPAGQHQIQRYNTVTDSVDIGFPLLPTLFIRGMATCERRLYASLDGQRLQVFTFDGTIVDTVLHARTTFYMTIADSIIYSVDPSSSVNQISRFDLRTGGFLPNLAAPAKFLEGIRVHDNQLYFCDRFRNFVGVVPLSELRPAQDL
jgi:hypothetical protein